MWLTDFVGFIPMPDGGDHEAYLTADYNAEMIEHIARFPRIRDRAVFVGNRDDVIPETFGPDLPKIPDWTEEHFDFSGYITGFTPPTPEEADEWRSDFGYDPEEKVCLVAVGGSGVGRDLLEKVLAAYPMAKEKVPELRMVAVAGPRIDPESLPRPDGVEVHGYVDQLYRNLSVCDLAVVQGGLTTTMELTAAKRPFLYFPLQESLRAELPRPASSRPVRGGSLHGVRRHRPRCPRRRPSPPRSASRPDTATWRPTAPDAPRR